MNHRRAETDFPVLEVIAERWSPAVFEPRSVEREKLWTCLEAARWAASSFNEQPWAFVVAERENADEFAHLLDCLVEANQAWAKQAGVLLLTVVQKNFVRNNKPNRVAAHDLGMATAHFSLQATALGLHTHHMAGVNLSKARHTYGIPETHEPFTAIALGYAGDPETAEEQIAQGDQQPRTRKPLREFVFHGQWRQPVEL